MKIIKQVPNTLTLLNLFCGFIAIVISFNINTLHYAPFFIFIAACFDFVDGLAARILNAYSDLGKQLDSLSDAISFGLAPGIFMFHLLEISNFEWINNSFGFIFNVSLASIIPIFSVIRLAKFNIDTRQVNSFRGLPTPASAIFLSSLVILVLDNQYQWLTSFILNGYFLIAIIILDAYLMVSGLPMFSFKIKSFKWADNAILYIFVLITLFLFFALQFISIPLVIITYIILSLITTFFKKKSDRALDGNWSANCNN